MFSAARYKGALVAVVGKQGDDFMKTFDHENVFFVTCITKFYACAGGNSIPLADKNAATKQPVINLAHSVMLSSRTFLTLNLHPGGSMDHRLLEIVACPVCTGKLYFNKENQELVCKVDGLAYPLRDGIPVLLENEARALSLDEKHA